MLIRAGIGLFKGSKHRWLEGWLREKGLLLFVLSPESLIQTVMREPMDLMIFSDDFLGNDGESLVRKIAANKDAPIVSLLLKSDNIEAQARFLAAGCETVIPSSIADQHLKETIENLIQKRLEQQTVKSLAGFREPKIEDFASESEAARDLVKLARKVVSSSSSLLILGETGVGKERLALAIHREGSRGPFVPINCAALPENLLESELFGHEQGAFTGAVRARRGAFELAHKGTIFLDEVGDMPLHLQSKLLRVLQDKEFQKIGGEKRIHVDVRIMAATNHDLQKSVEAGRFRRDLFYRLSVVNIMIPPLRARPQDIPSLVRKLVNQLPPRYSQSQRHVDEKAMKSLVAYDWPGNVRELMNVLERAILLGNGSLIELEDLPTEMTRCQKKMACAEIAGAGQESLGIASELPSWKEARATCLEQFEKRYLEKLMQSCSGRVGLAATRAGITPRALHQKLTRHSINKEKYK